MPGYKLPPLMFNPDETLALAIGLRVARELGLSDMAPAVASTSAKLDRVMPKALKRKIGNLDAVVSLDLARPHGVAGSEFFARITQCASAGQRISIRYRAADGSASTREIDPYGLGYLYGAWYLVGYCHSRRALRSFRLDRVQTIAPLPKAFARPAGFDVLAHLRESIAAMGRAHAIVVQCDAPLADVRRAIAPSLGILHANGRGTRMDAQADDLAWFARELMRLPFAFRIVKPKALRAALVAHAHDLARLHGGAKRA
jgi:predicted DNA-binding transcriptional regulator YafY